MINVNKLFLSFFHRGVCSKGNRKHVIRVSIELKKHLKSYGNTRLSTRGPTEIFVLRNFYKRHVFFFSIL